MKQPDVYCAVCDFELVPYALGDALTFNVQTAIRCEEAGRKRVDIYLCIDPDPATPGSVFQRELVRTENAFLLFSEIFGAFGTHPKLGNILIYTNRDEMRARLREIAEDDPVNTEVVSDYETILAKRDDPEARIAYFLKYIYSHEHINAFAERTGSIPLLEASKGCQPDVDGIKVHLLGGRRIVVVHPRLRRLDAGLRGHHTYFRDSDFLEWYEFLRKAGELHPEVQFVVVGRLQEKPIELLRLPNVTSLRVLGLGIGHELTLLKQADLFIGTSSGFAAMANFTEVPYFIVHLNKETYKAYAIPEGSPRLPFAFPNQELAYEPETTELLMRLLERGLALPSRGNPPSPVKRSDELDVRAFRLFQHTSIVPGALTGRFFVDDQQADQETAALIEARIHQGYDSVNRGDFAAVDNLVHRVGDNFPRVAARYPAFATLSNRATPSAWDWSVIRVRRALLNVSGRLLPTRMRGSLVHRALKRLKDVVAGYRR